MENKKDKMSFIFVFSIILGAFIILFTLARTSTEELTTPETRTVEIVNMGYHVEENLFCDYVQYFITVQDENETCYTLDISATEYFSYELHQTLEMNYTRLVWARK